MSELFGGILKPGEGAQAALRRELENRRDRWSRDGYLYRGGGDFILRHGQFFSGRELPAQYEHLIGPQTHCFLNTLRAVRQEPGLRYCEGVYAVGGHFTPHAWALDPDDRVVELTHPTTNLEGYIDIRSMPILPPETWAYAGVVFHPDLVQWALDSDELPMFDRPAADQETGRLRGLDMAQDTDFPILKVPYDPDRRTL